MPEMAQFVYDFYNSKLQMWSKSKRENNEVQETERREDRLRKLDEEEKVLRERLEETMRNQEVKSKQLLIDSDSSSSENESANDQDVQE